MVPSPVFLACCLEEYYFAPYFLLCQKGFVWDLTSLLFYWLFSCEKCILELLEPGAF